MYKRIGVIGAMDEEIEILKKILENSALDIKFINKAVMEFVETKLNNDKTIILVRSGIGKVNAAICTQILIDIFKVELVINTGIAGALSKEVEIGDIVISKDLVEHDMDATAFGYNMGQIPRMDTFSFSTDETLCNVVYETCRRVNTDINVFIDRIVSGDKFVSSYEVKEELFKNFNGLCTEMEGAAIAHACYLNNIHFVVIRAISDRADKAANITFEQMKTKAIEHCAKLTLELIMSVL